MPPTQPHWICPRNHRWEDEPPNGRAPACPICGEAGAPAPPSYHAGDDQATVGAPPAPNAKAGEGLAAVRVEGYEILEEIGRGGMGVVYKARQHGLNRIVALKMILAAEHAGEDQVKRFQAEAEAIAQLQHPHIVQIYDVSQAGERPFFSMEFVDGGSLAAKLTGHPQPVRASALLIEALARAMHYAHERGVVHRDLKPANILLAPVSSSDSSFSDPSSVVRLDFPLGLPKVTDFGLAKRLNSAGPTQSGAVMGTPSYMAPEQAAGRTKEIGPAADIYALGSILYELLTGRPPFRAESPMDTLLQVMRDEPVPPSRLVPKLPRDLEVICLKCLQKQPAQRYATALALADDLRHFLSNEPISARPATVFQRGRHWVRRHPVWAASITVAHLMGLVLLTGGLDYHFKLQRQKDQLDVERNRVAEEKAQAMQRLVRLTVANGVQHLNDDDLLGSLPWFAEALKQEAGNREREEMHRIRLAAVLRQSPRLVRVRFHDGRVSDAAFSPDGRSFVSGGDDGLAAVTPMDAAGKSAVAKVGSAVRVVAFDRTGHRFLTVGADRTVFVWDSSTGQFLGTPMPHHGAVTSACFSADGQRMLTTCTDRAARIWDVATGQPVGPEFKHEGAVRCAAFHPDSKLIATGGDDGVALIWNVVTGEPVSLPMQHGGPVVSVAFSPDGKHLLTAGGDAARLWEVPTGMPQPVLKHVKPVTAAAFSPDGKHVVTAGMDNVARVWDAAGGQAVTPALKHSSHVHSAAFSPDGRWIVTAGDDNAARVWDAKTGDAVAPPLKHNGSVFRATFSADGRHVLTASLDGLARAWEVGLAPRTAEMKLDPEMVQRLIYSPDGRRVLAVGTDGTCRLRDASTGKQIGEDLTHAAPVLFASFSPDGGRVLTASEDRRAKVWDAATGKQVGRSLHHGSSVVHAAFGPRGDRVATASADNTARVWDAETGKPLSQPLRHMGSVRRVAFSPDGRAVLTASQDGTARLWDAATGESLTPSLPQTGWVRQVLTAPQDERGWDLSSDPRPVEHLLRLAQWLSGQRIDETGGTTPLDTEALKKLWEELKAEQADDLAPSPAAQQSWHRRAATQCEQAGDWYAAATHLDELLKSDPKNSGLRLRRARAAAEQADWPRAAADFAAVLAEQPDDVALQISAALAKLAAGDRTGYRRACAALARQGKAAGGDTAQRLAWLCVLAADEGEAATALELADRAKAARPDAEGGEALRGAALFRAGKWQDALRALQASQAAADPGDAVRAWLYLAMTEARLKQPDEARRWLTRARTWLDRHAGEPTVSWRQRLELTLLRGEAEAMLGVVAGS
ncbi:MAG: protein kinase domain-containing protein [Gemmataceae bacterium]